VITKRRFIVALVAVAVAAGTAAIVNHRVRTLPENAVLRYGDTVVTAQQLGRRVAVLEAVYGVEPPTRGPARVRFNRDAAKSYAVSLVLDDIAASRGIKVSDQAASREVTLTVKKKLGGDDDAFIDFLAHAGVNRADIVDEVRRTIAARRLFARVTADVPEVTTAQARRVYTSQRSRMKSPEQRTLRTIVVPSESEAARIRQQLDGGADFATMARQASRDAVSMADGGLLGTLPRSALEPAFGKAAFSAKAGSVFGPVRGQHGWNVGRVDAVVPPRPLAFDEMKGALTRQLTADRQAAAWDPWLRRQLRAAEVEYAPDYRPKDPIAVKLPSTSIHANVEQVEGRRRQ